MIWNLQIYSKQIVDYHNVKTPYYSHDFQNVHCISMSHNNIHLKKEANNMNL